MVNRCEIRYAHTQKTSEKTIDPTGITSKETTHRAAIHSAGTTLIKLAKSFNFPFLFPFLLTALRKYQLLLRPNQKDYFVGTISLLRCNRICGD